jgi:hypothetical protein
MAVRRRLACPNPSSIFEFERLCDRLEFQGDSTSSAAFGFLVPILIDDGGVTKAGHGRYDAAVLLDLQEVRVIRVEGLSEEKRRALALADNKIAENAGWDRELLAAELPELAEILIVERRALTGALRLFRRAQNDEAKEQVRENHGQGSRRKVLSHQIICRRRANTARLYWEMLCG